MAIERLSRAGLEQYEISNFSRSGRTSRHNLRYWKRRPYLGVGLDASSLLAERETGAGRVLRTTTTDDLQQYLAGREPVECAWLEADKQHEEAWFLGLRLNAGVNLAELEREFGAARLAAACEVVERQMEAGLLCSDGKTVRLSLIHILPSANICARCRIPSPSPVWPSSASLLCWSSSSATF